MALINEAYHTLTSGKDPVKKSTVKEDNSAGLALHKDPAYVFYKQGLKLYNASDLTMSTGTHYYRSKQKSQSINRPSGVELENAIVKALYCFNLICMNYPGSLWYEDSIVKIRTLNIKWSTVKEWKKRRNRWKFRLFVK